MKLNVRGKTPMERLANLTRRIVAVPKEQLEREDKKRRERISASRPRKK